MKAPAVRAAGLQGPHQALESQPCQHVGRTRLAVDRDAMNAELEARRDFRQRLIGAFAAGEAVGDDADVMAAVGLAVGEIQDMTDDAADGSARRVQDTEWLA